MLAEIPVHRPDSLAEALDLLAAPPQEEQLTVLAGGTDLMVLLNARSSVPQRVLDIWKLDALRGIRRLGDGRLEIGALSTYRELILSPLVQEHSPALVAASRTVGAVQIQARGTLGGNVANASPAGTKTRKGRHRASAAQRESTKPRQQRRRARAAQAGGHRITGALPREPRAANAKTANLVFPPRARVVQKAGRNRTRATPTATTAARECIRQR